MSGRRRRARAPGLGVDPKILEGLAKTMDEIRVVVENSVQDLAQLAASLRAQAAAARER
jgi:hypothetical protein